MILPDDTDELAALRARTMHRIDEQRRQHWRERNGRHITDLLLALALVAILAALTLGWQP